MRETRRTDPTRPVHLCHHAFTVHPQACRPQERSPRHWHVRFRSASTTAHCPEERCKYTSKPSASSWLSNAMSTRGSWCAITRKACRGMLSRFFSFLSKCMLFSCKFTQINKRNTLGCREKHISHSRAISLQKRNKACLPPGIPRKSASERSHRLPPRNVSISSTCLCHIGGNA